MQLVQKMDQMHKVPCLAVWSTSVQVRRQHHTLQHLCMYRGDVISVVMGVKMMLRNGIQTHPNPPNIKIGISWILAVTPHP